MNPIQNILVIVDPTADSHPAIAKAALLAEKFAARMELFVCDTKAARETRFAGHLQRHPGTRYVYSLKGVLESLAEPLRDRGIDVTTETECADPLAEGLISRTRRTTADLVIKDTHHHALARRTFLTNTDWELIRHCPVPLLLTKAGAWGTVPRVLAAVDPEHFNDKPALLDRHILEYAKAFAQRLGGELDVVHAYIPISIIAGAVALAPAAAAVSPEQLEQEREAKVAVLQGLLSDFGVDAVHTHLELGGPAALLPRIAATLHASVIAMGAISRGGLKRVLLGSTAEDVLERLPCDALIVKSPDFDEPLSF